MQSTSRPGDIPSRVTDSSRVNIKAHADSSWPHLVVSPPDDLSQSATLAQADQFGTCSQEAPDEQLRPCKTRIDELEKQNTVLTRKIAAYKKKLSAVEEAKRQQDISFGIIRHLNSELRKHGLLETHFGHMQELACSSHFERDIQDMVDFLDSCAAAARSYERKLVEKSTEMYGMQVRYQENLARAQGRITELETCLDNARLRIRDDNDMLLLNELRELILAYLGDRCSEYMRGEFNKGVEAKLEPLDHARCRKDNMAGMLTDIKNTFQECVCAIESVKTQEVTDLITDYENRILKVEDSLNGQLSDVADLHKKEIQILAMEHADKILVMEQEHGDQREEDKDRHISKMQELEVHHAAKLTRVNEQYRKELAYWYEVHEKTASAPELSESMEAHRKLTNRVSEPEVRQTAEREIAELRERLSSQEITRQRMISQVLELDELVNEVIDARECVADVNAGLLEQVQTKTARVAELEIQNSELGSRLDDSIRAYSRLWGDFQAAQLDLAHARNVKDEELHLAGQKLKESEAHVQSIAQRLNGAKNSMARKNLDIENATRLITKLKSDNGTLAAKLDEANILLAAADKSKEDLTAKNVALRYEASLKEVGLTRATDCISRLQIQIDQLQVAEVESIGATRGLCERLGRNDELLTELEYAIDQLANENSALNDEIERLRDGIELIDRPEQSMSDTEKFEIIESSSLD